MAAAVRRVTAGRIDVLGELSRAPCRLPAHVTRPFTRPCRWPPCRTAAPGRGALGGC